MTVLAYQAFIVFSLIAIRFIARRYLLTACVIWSGFTVFNLFFWPLVLVQLAVVWLTYAVLRPKDDAPQSPSDSLAPISTPTPAEPESAPTTRLGLSQAPVAPIPPARTTDPAAHQSLLGDIHRAIANIDRSVSHANAIHEATRQLDLDIYAEKNSIESQLTAAHQALQRQAFFAEDLRNQQLYEESKARISKLLDKQKLDKSDGATQDFPPPDFTRQIHHPDADIDHAISQRISELQQQREAFLSNLKLTLARNEALRDLFFKGMEDSKHRKIWAALRPRLQPSSVVVATSRAQSPVEVIGTHSKATTKMTFGSLLGVELQPQPKLQELGTPTFESVAATSQWRSGIAPPEGSATHHSDIRRLVVKELLGELNNATTHRSNIRRLAVERNIEHLLHFTNVANLPSIMAHGLLSVRSARLRGLFPLVNDQLRLDGHIDAVSLSISFPNANLFYKYRQLHPQQRWVVLILKPEILWVQDCAYCQYNAADKRISTRSWSTLVTYQAFESMFDEAPQGIPSRAAQRLTLADPTDVQAEVLVRGDIAPSMVEGLIFGHEDDLDTHRVHAVGRRAKVQVPGDGYFGTRRFARSIGSTD